MPGPEEAGASSGSMSPPMEARRGMRPDSSQMDRLSTSLMHGLYGKQTSRCPVMSNKLLWFAKPWMSPTMYSLTQLRGFGTCEAALAMHGIESM